MDGPARPVRRTDPLRDAGVAAALARALPGRQHAPHLHRARRRAPDRRRADASQTERTPSSSATTASATTWTHASRRGSSARRSRCVLDSSPTTASRRSTCAACARTRRRCPALLDVARRRGLRGERRSRKRSRRASMLPASWDDYLGTLSKKDRHEMRRKMRRLDSAGDIEMKIITTADEAAPLLDTLFHLMRISNHHKEEFLDRPGMMDFFREMTARYGRRRHAAPLLADPRRSARRDGPQP